MNLLRWLRFVCRRLFVGFPDWHKRGRFEGDVVLKWNGPRSYALIPNPENPLRFYRGTRMAYFEPSGQVVQPGEMETDGGSIPQFAWSLPGLNPWGMLPAFLVHDWEFDEHHRGASPKSFEQVNLTLLEACYTLMLDRPRECPYSEFILRLIWDGVASPIGRDVWDGAWIAK